MRSVALQRFFHSRDWREHLTDIWKALTYISRYGRTHVGVTRVWTMSDVRRQVRAVNYFLEREEEEMKKASSGRRRR